MHVVELEGAHHDDGNETEQEHQAAEQSEEVHRLDAKLRLEPKGKQVKVTVDKAVESELGRAILARLVLDLLLADAGETSNLGQIGDIAVHVAIDLDVLDHLAAIGLEAAVEVVQVVDTADASCRGVEELGGDGLAERVVAFFLPAADEVITVLGDHAVKLGDLVGTVLQVGIHRDDDVAAGIGKTGVQSRGLAIVAAEGDALHPRVLVVQPPDDLPRVVGAAVVDEQHLVGEAVLVHDALDPLCQLGQ